MLIYLIFSYSKLKSVINDLYSFNHFTIIIKIAKVYFFKYLLENISLSRTEQNQEVKFLVNETDYPIISNLIGSLKWIYSDKISELIKNQVQIGMQA